MENNLKIKFEAKKNRVRLWEIAEFLGIQESYLSKLLRKPLTPEKEKELLNAVKELSGVQNEK